MKGGPDKVDVHVGTRIRMRRTLLGLSQEKLAGALGVTFQQVQKYERGVNRLGAGRLYQTSRVLGVPVDFFFEGAPKKNVAPLSARVAESPTIIEEEGSSILTKKETIDLIRNYYNIEDPKVRRKVLEMIKTLATTSDEEQPSTQKSA